MNTIVIEARQCPSCGRLLPKGALDGLCPACLLAQGAETDAGGTGAGTRFTPPPLAEVAKLFPQLEILDLLGAGGMGAVYKARQPALDRIVALKILPAASTSTANSANFEERFNREARALARLNHPNIVAVYEFGRAGTLHFFLMEFVDGANLRQLAHVGRLAPREALQIIPQICDALQYAHDEGVVHRDIKPENVLVDRKGRVKIADFGLAKIMDQDPDQHRLTIEGQVMGTPHYMAPEQVERPLTVDHRADIYSLGVVFYEMLTGDLPLGKFSPPSRKYQLDVRLDDVVLRALENDPARRYQKVSEVKSQVENIAGTPPPVASGSVPPIIEKQFIRWLGFPVVVENGGMRNVHHRGTLHAFGILFGVITIVFGLVSLVAGRSLFDWFGILGGPSLLMRLLISGVLVAWAVWHALRLKQVVEPPPQTPQGTVILPPEKLSRKAVVGVCFLPFAFIAFLLWVVVTPQSLPATTSWWQIALSVTVLPLGLMAPFATTMLGWIAVGDIRRARGRMSGLPLAVFDGLVFPLLALNTVMVGAGLEAVRWLGGQWSLNPGHWGPITGVMILAMVLVCVLVDFFIVRRVWSAVRLNKGAKLNPWWVSKRGAIAIGVACALIIPAVGERRSPSHSSKVPPQQRQVQQVARRDAKTGRLVVDLPGRGKVELLAIGEPGAAPNGWWLPDGKLITNATFGVRGDAEMTAPGRARKDLLFRVSNLPQGVSRYGTEADPESGASGGGEVFRDGKPLPGAWQMRFAWEPEQRMATVRMGFGFEPWRTIATESVVSQSGTQERLPTDPNWSVSFHRPPYGSKDNAHVSVVFGPADRLWAHRVVAVDTNGVEHTYNSGQGTPIEKQTLWTYTWNHLPLPTVKEFRLQVQPVHWVEFRNVALLPRTPVPKPRPAQFGPVQELTFDEIIDFDSSIAASFPPDRGGPNPFASYANLVWMQQKGFDAGAGIGKLYTVDMDFTLLETPDWDALPAPDLVKRIYQNHFRPGQLMALADGRLPATYGFRTREDGIGILQLMAFADGKPGATVRFKLLQRETDQPGPTRGSNATKLQIAKRDAESGALVAKLPKRGIVELLAVSEENEALDPEAATRAWWLPDGSTIPDRRYAVTRYSGAAPPRKCVLIRRHELPEGAAGPYYEWDAQQSDWGSGVVSRNGEPLEGASYLRGVFPPTTTRTTLRLGFGLGLWQTISTHDGNGHSNTFTRLPEYPNLHATVHQINEAGGQVVVTMGIDREGRNWNMRVMAIDTNGVEHSYVEAAVTSVEKTSIWTYKFDLTQAQLKDFQVQLRPVHWMEFRDVALQARPQPVP